MQSFLASDVVYKARVAPLIKQALDDAGVTGQQIADSAVPGQHRVAQPARSSPSGSARPPARTNQPPRAGPPRPRPHQRVGRRQHAAAVAGRQPRPGHRPRDVQRRLPEPGRQRRERRARDGDRPRAAARRSRRARPSRRRRPGSRRGRHPARPDAADRHRERERRRRGRPRARRRPTTTARPTRSSSRAEARSPGAAARARRARRPLVAACPLAPAGGLSFRAVDELTTTTGIVALAGRRARADRAAVRSSCSRAGSATLRADQRVVLGERERDLVGHAAELEREFRSLHELRRGRRRRGSRRRLDDRRAAPRRRDRPPRARPLRRLQRDVGPPVDLDRAARRPRRRGSCCPRSTTATRRGCTPSRSSTGAASSSSRPRRQEAVRVALARRGARRAPSERAADARRLPRARGHVQRGGAAGGAVGGDGAAELVPLADDPRDGHGASSAATSTAALVPIENSLEGSVNATLDALALEARERRDRRRGRARRPPLPDRARRDRARRRSRPSSRTRRRSAQCARFLRERAARARRSCAATRPPRRCATVAAADAPWAALGTALAAELYGGAVLREGVEDEPDNETRFVWLARATGDAAGARRRERRRGRRRSCSGAPATGRRAGSCAAWRSSPSAASTSRGSSRGRASGGSGTTCSSSTSTGRADDPARRPTRSPRSAAHCEEVRVLGSLSRGAEPATARRLSPRRSRPLHFRRRNAAWAVTTPPAPAGSAPAFEHRRRGRECWPGARPQRDVRADQRLHGPPRRRAAAEGEGRAVEHATVGAALRAHRDAAPGRDPARHLRQRPARHAPAQDHAARRLRPRRLDLPVLRLALEPDRRPRDPALQGRRLELGEHRRLVRAVQPAQGRPPAGAGRHAPAPDADARRARTSSSTSPARRSRRPGGSGCPTSTCSPTRRSGAPGRCRPTPRRPRGPGSTGRRGRTRRRRAADARRQSDETAPPERRRAPDQDPAPFGYINWTSAARARRA